MMDLHVKPQQDMHELCKCRYIPQVASAVHAMCFGAELLTPITREFFRGFPIDHNIKKM